MHHIYPREEVEQEDTSPYIGSIPRDNRDFQLNGNIHMTGAMLKLVAVSAAKAELRPLFFKHPRSEKHQATSTLQPTTSVHVEYVNNTIKRQLPTAIEMGVYLTS